MKPQHFLFIIWAAEKITCLGKMPSPNVAPIGFAGFEYGLWGIGFGGSPVDYQVCLSHFKVQGNFLLLCSSTNFVGYSY